jgi:hypothetical protein
VITGDRAVITEVLPGATLQHIAGRGRALAWAQQGTALTRMKGASACCQRCVSWIVAENSSITCAMASRARCD